MAWGQFLASGDKLKAEIATQSGAQTETIEAHYEADVHLRKTLAVLAAKEPTKEKP